MSINVGTILGLLVMIALVVGLVSALLKFRDFNDPNDE